MISSPSISRNITVLRDPQISPETGVLGESILPFVSRANTSTKDVEVFYAITDQNAKNIEELKLKEIDYLTSDGKTVSLPLDCRSLKLALRFFQESPSNIFKVRINYTFTLKTDKDSKKALVKQWI